MEARIAKGLERLFDTHRIVFWYDDKQEMGELFAALSLDGVEKIAIANDEFQVKFRILRQEPKQKFLIYREGPEPALIDNWLLDVQLASTVFKADQVAMWLSDLGLPPAFETVLRDHEEFFRSKKRLEALKRVLPQDYTATRLKRRMLSVCAEADGGFDTAVEGLLADLAQDKDDRLRLIERIGLTEFLWDQMGRYFGYRNDEANIEDFAMTLFKSCLDEDLDQQSSLNNESPVFFKRWKNNRKTSDDFEILSDRFAPLLCKR